MNMDWQIRCASLPAGYTERYPFTDQFYRENTQNRAEEPSYIFISVSGQDILNPTMSVLALFTLYFFEESIKNAERKINRN